MKIQMLFKKGFKAGRKTGKSYHCALCNVLGRINGCAGCTFLEISSRAVGTVRAEGGATLPLPRDLAHQPILF